jgi:DNA repair protein RadC
MTPTQIQIPIQKFFYALSLSKTERTFVVSVDRQRQVCGYIELAERPGAVSQEIREVFKAAIVSNFTTIIYARHTLDLTIAPSPQDMKMAEGLIKAGKVLGIEIDDYIIVNKESEHCIRGHQPKVWRQLSNSKSKS